MNDYTPDEDAIRAVWRGHWDPESIAGKNADGEFSRWLAGALTEAKQQAWIACADQAYRDQFVDDFDRDDLIVHCPYGRDTLEQPKCNCGYGGYHEPENIYCDRNEAML